MHLVRMAGGLSRNFAFLSSHDEQLARLPALAERYFAEDPNTCLLKLRQFAECLAQEVAARSGVYQGDTEPFADLLRRLSFERLADRPVLDLFHALRRSGNSAAHAHAGTHSEALSALKISRQLAVWFHRTFGSDPSFRPGSFEPPSAPPDAASDLKDELARLKAELEQTRGALEAAAQSARAQTEEKEVWAELAAAAEAEKAEFAARLAQLQARPRPEAERREIEKRASAASELVDLDEAATRSIIDGQLRSAGWEADSKSLRHSLGARPSSARNLAIAEWPTDSGPADYALFAGEQLVGIVEAKRCNTNAQAALTQAERYACSIALAPEHQSDGAPWSDFSVPFVFSTNGRPFLNQLRSLSGIWFRDARDAKNLARPLSAWPTADGLLQQLRLDRAAAQLDLRSRGFDFGFALRPYQKAAIETVENALAQDARQLLIAMATGTGKTKLAIAMLFRLLSAKRFRRVCFVVDRSALANQTKDEFTTTQVVTGRAFSQIFGLKGLEDVTPDDDTRIHICTIQGLTKRVLYAATPEEVPPIDQYDLLVVDECHRGYLLDREMSDAELSFRSQEDYVSKYRRVLEHFDAVKIGLTATPALHTTEIFGPPIFTYSYREAVVDGYLTDHEPPIRIDTRLAQSGIRFVREEEVEFVHAPSGTVQKATMPDDLEFEVEQFNKSVVTVEFNRAVAAELARHIDPTLPGKTLVFAANDAHADIIVDELKQAFERQYGSVDDAAVRKITGKVDQVARLIRSYRNDALPSVAVTVDLLTTGIDIPRIVNLVFLRRVNSRILYEQMLGRATRRCPEIEKEAFRIFDAVDLYRNLQSLTDMRPIVADPKVTMEQLFKELAEIEDQAHRASVRDQLVVKLRRRLKRLPEVVRAQLEAEAGEGPNEILDRLSRSTLEELAGWARARPKLGPILDWTSDDGTPRMVPISTHPDEVIAVGRGYGDGLARPEDFLDTFTSWVKNNVNSIAALKVVTERPRELTRADLRALRLKLDEMGFTDANLKSAYAQARNEEIAASIIGYLRQAALGDPLIPYADRVRAAIGRVLSAGTWTQPQREWLRRIGNQIEVELVVDREALDQAPFDEHGGFDRLNRVFNGKVEDVVGRVADEMWRQEA